ncbi:hypothetical protein [Kaarinaea lacus]
MADKIQATIVMTISLVFLQACAVNEHCQKRGGDTSQDINFKYSRLSKPRYVVNKSNAVELAQSIQLAYQFLYDQMDKLHKTTIIYDEPNFSHYYPSGIMGDAKALEIDTNWQANPISGNTGLRISYDPKKNNVKQWAGIYFQYPEKNWGDKKGRDLSGAQTLRFWAKADRKIEVKFISGGINKVEKNPVLYQEDSYGPIEQWIPVMQNWEEHTIDLTGQDLSNVIGPFAVVFKADDALDPVTLYLDNIVIDQDTLSAPRFIQSYEPIAYPTPSPPNIAHVYDQSLVLLALLARGTDEDIRRAKLIADAMLLVQDRRHTRDDWALRNAYSSGEVLDYYTGDPRAPGWWNDKSQTYCQDSFALGNDTGNNAWAGIALIQLHHVLDQRADQSYRNQYLEAAEKIAQWVVTHQSSSGKYGGFIGGFEVAKLKKELDHEKISSPWQSSEHHIDLVVLFNHLSMTYRPTDRKKSQYWETQAEYANKFIRDMWQKEDDVPMHLWTGTNIYSSDIKRNEEVVPLDVQTWAVLALNPKEYSVVLDWALMNCVDKNNAHGFDFDCNDGDGTWWEGTAQMVTALHWLNRHDEANTILNELRMAQITDDEPKGAIPAANTNELSTGFKKAWGPWVYTNEPHIGATAWYLFAVLKKNPYYIVNASE